MDQAETFPEDERLIARIETADLLSGALIEAWKTTASAGHEQGHDRRLLQYARGELPREEGRLLLQDLASCSHCRRQAWAISSALGRAEGGECRLADLVWLLEDWPEAGALALAHVSRRLTRLQLPPDMLPLRPQELRLTATNTAGQATGERGVLLCTDGPRLDASHRFYLSMSLVEPQGAGGKLRLALIDESGPMVIAEPELGPAGCALRLDWTCLQVAPGFFRPSALGGQVELAVSTLAQRASVLKTSPRVTALPPEAQPPPEGVQQSPRQRAKGDTPDQATS